MIELPIPESLYKYVHGESYELDEALEALMPHEERKQAVDYCVSNNKSFSSKWIVHHMPVTAKSIQDGSLTLEKFVVIFEREWNLGLIRDINQIRFFISDMGTMAIHAIPDRFVTNGGIGEGEYSRERKDFATAVKEKVLQSIDVKQPELSPLQVISKYKAAVDATCEINAKRFDALFFRGKKGIFLKKCPLYKKPERAFYDKLVARKQPRCLALLKDHLLVAQTGLELIGKIQLAAMDVTADIYCEHKKCWECDLVSKTTSICSCCKVAVYCNRECQLKAWKTGHKGMCSNIKEKYETFKASRMLLDAKHDSEWTLLAPCSVLADYDVWHWCVYEFYKYSFQTNRLHAWLSAAFDSKYSRPSMKVFIDNLERVQKGQFWFFRTTETLQEYKRRIEHEGKEEEEEVLFSILSQMLCHDYVGYLEDQGLSATAFDDYFSFSTASTEESFLFVNEKLRELFRLQGMPMERFIELRVDTPNPTEPLDDYEAFADKRRQIGQRVEKWFFRQCRLSMDAKYLQC